MLLLPGGQAGVDWVKNNQRCFKHKSLPLH